MARVLYTTRERGRRSPAFVEASSLAEAERALGPRTDLRFWSHPALGAPPGSSAEDAYARVPKPRTWPGWAVAVAAATMLPGLLASFAAVIAEHVGLPSPIPPEMRGAATLSMLAGLALTCAAFPLMERALADREYAVAAALLWVLRLGMLPAWPVLEVWAVRVRAGRRGLDGALAPYRWMRLVGLGRLFDLLEDQALRQLVRTDERIRALEVRVAHGARLPVKCDLAMCLVVYRGDADGAEAVLARAASEPSPRLLAAAQQAVRAFVALERREEGALEAIEAARRAFTAAGSIGSLAPLFDLQTARALARSGSVEAAEAMFGRAAPPLLRRGEHLLLDRAAADLDAARSGGDDARGLPPRDDTP